MTLSEVWWSSNISKIYVQRGKNWFMILMGIHMEVRVQYWVREQRAIETIERLTIKRLKKVILLFNNTFIKKIMSK